MRLDDDELVEHGREWYVEFMEQVIAATPDITTDTPAALWEDFSEDYQISVAKALYQFRKTYKEQGDATEHFAYAEKYRGAADDDGEGWRPPFEYYVQRRTEAVSAELNLAEACRNLHEVWEGQVGDPTTQYYMELFASTHEAMQNNLTEQVDGLREAAEDKVKLLEREKEERVEAERKEEKKKKAAEKKKKQKAKKKQKKKKGQDEDTEMVDADGRGGEEPVKGSTSKAGGGEGEGGDKADYSDGEGEADPRKDGGDAGDSGDGGEGKVAAGVESGSEEIAWHGQQKVGEGGEGTAYLWLKTGADGKISNRVVRKTVNLNGNWDKAHLWTNGAPAPDAATPIGTIPTEVAAGLNIRSRGGCSSIVELKNYSFEGRRLNIYLEWCPYRSATKLVVDTSYDSSLHDNRKELPHEDVSHVSTLVPEPFCWATFLSLVTAGLMMERGQIAAAGADPLWEAIIHRDLKLENIFLGVQPQSNFVGYPQPKVGDFGTAILVPPNDSRNVTSLIQRATDDHNTPEQLGELLGPDSATVVRQSSKTNVWGVGIVMYSILAGQFGPVGEGEDLWFDFSKADRREPPSLDATARGTYSVHLRNLVMACLRFNTDNRPTFDHLLQECMKYTNPAVPADDQADGMRDIQPSDANFDQKYYQTHELKYDDEDKYQIGLAYAAVDFEEDGTTAPPGLWDV
ncbi:putative serine/threonine-protein kinase, active [Septoria linicola]|nr:putative serine/threonine-protein kinase, active [Septoria linicola]